MLLQVAHSEALVCQVYKSNTESVDKARYLLFCTGSKQEASLPPTQDALTQHVKRANYQSGIWRPSFESLPVVPSPIGNGWTVESNGSLQYVWMTKPHLPLMIFCNHHFATVITRHVGRDVRAKLRNCHALVVVNVSRMKGAV